MQRAKNIMKSIVEKIVVSIIFIKINPIMNFFKRSRQDVLDIYLPFLNPIMN